MRSTLLALIAATLLLTAPAARAAPTCQDANGDTIRCGTAGAMPVGWTLPPRQRLERQMSQPTGVSPGMAAGLICFLFGFFALIALMPDFDGRWDRQEEEDDEGRR